MRKQRTPIFILTAVAAWFAVGAAQAAIDKVTSSTMQPVRTPSTPIPADALLDVGIPPLNDGLHLTDEDDTVFPEVRFAEAIYFANQLAKIMEKSGAWGAIRVIPNRDVIMDVYITGTILQSDGETLELEMQVYDTSGQQWLDKRYSQVTGKYAYDRRLKNLGDPFQNLFTQIANDVLEVREQLTTERAARLRQISELRFARDFSPEAFDQHINRNKKGILEVERLPAENDSILQRVHRIRERDYLYVDTMQDYYDVFSQNMHLAYQDFRRASYDSVVKARQLNKQGNRRIIAGIGAILAGIYGRYEGQSYYARDAGTATAAAGGYTIKAGLEKKAEAAAYNESVAEMGASLESEIAPQVIELEDRTITLSGTVQGQYEQWRKLLKQIYEQERGG
jgi:hypothetical protein